MADDSKTSWTPGPLRWLDADDWQETAERGQPFTISDADNDVAEVFHNNDSTVSTTPEQAAAYCRMFVAAPNMVGALADLLQMFAQPGESSNDRFERLAEAFYRDTGVMAPGKDVPAAMVDCMTYEDRRERWDAWVSAKIVRAYVALSLATGKEG